MTAERDRLRRVDHGADERPDTMVGAPGATYAQMLAEREPTPAESQNRTTGYDGRRAEQDEAEA